MENLWTSPSQVCWEPETALKNKIDFRREQKKTKMLLLRQVTRNVWLNVLKSTFLVSLSVINKTVNILAKEVASF